MSGGKARRPAGPAPPPDGGGGVGRGDVTTDFVAPLPVPPPQAGEGTVWLRLAPAEAPNSRQHNAHHAPPTVMTSSPEGATVQASRSNSTVVVPNSWISAGPAMLFPALSAARW